MKMCIYHGGCADGFGAAWVVRRAIGDIEFYEGKYQSSPPDVTGKEVIIVDFSYKRPVLLEMASVAKSILVIDHHKTAAEDLVDLPDNVTTVFDMSHSGAVLTWQHFFPGATTPELLRYIEDRDLWKFEHSCTRLVMAGLFSYPQDFETWDVLMESPNRLIHEGGVIERKHQKDLRDLLATTQRELFILGHRVPAANVPFMMASDAGHEMAKGKPFSVCYWDTPNGRKFSLRSTDEGVDVSEIAATFGGGGHRNAAGFKLSFERASLFEIMTGEAIA